MTLGLSSIENPALQHPVPGSIIMDDVNDELCQKNNKFSTSWFFEDISNVVVQCRWHSTISCRGLCLNNLERYLKHGGPA